MGLTRSSKSEKADEAVTVVADDEEDDDCLTVADRPAAMVAEASAAAKNSKAAPLIIMNNEEEADLSLSSVISSAGMIVWSIVEKISLSIALSFSALTYPYSICLPYYLFTFCCYKLLLLLQPIFPDVTLSLLLFGLYNAF